MLDADLLLLVPGPGKKAMTRRIFEYIVVRQPVLTIAEERVARELACKTGIGSVADPSDVEVITRESARRRRTIREGSFLYLDATEMLRQHDRRCIIGRLVSVLDRLVARQ